MHSVARQKYYETFHYETFKTDRNYIRIMLINLPGGSTLQLWRRSEVCWAWYLFYLLGLLIVHSSFSRTWKHKNMAFTLLVLLVACCFFSVKPVNGHITRILLPMLFEDFFVYLYGLMHLVTHMIKAMRTEACRTSTLGNINREHDTKCEMKARFA